MADLLSVSGARGPGLTEIARRTGNYGVEPADGDYVALVKFGENLLETNPGFQSTIPGPAGPTFTTLALFRAAPSGNKKQALAIPGQTPGDFYFETTNPPYVDDGVDTIKANDTALSVGAWKRQFGTEQITNATTPTGTRPSVLSGALALGTGTLTLDGAGDSGYALAGTNLRNSILTNTSTAPIVKQAAAGGEYERRGMSLSNFTLVGRAPIAINDPSLPVTDDGAAMRVYHNWRLDRMFLIDQDSNGDIGISITKGFNGLLTTSHVQGYNIGVLLHGSDINMLMNTRVRGYRQFGVYEASAQFFGSQNMMMNLDIVGGMAGSVALKTTGLHHRSYSLYAEPNVAGMKGYFDASLEGGRTFGTNTQDVALLSIVMRDHRADSQGLLADDGFVYRIDRKKSRTTRIEGIQTSDSSHAESFFCDAEGAPITYVPMHVALSGRGQQTYIEEYTFGPHWDGHRSKQGVTPTGDGFRITAENIHSVLFNTLTANANGVAAQKGQQIVIPAGNANRELPISPDGLEQNGNVYFIDGKTYQVVLLARSTAATGDTISIQQAGLDASGGGFGTGYQAFALTNQFKRCLFYMPGRPANYKAVGWNVKSVTSTGAIEFTLSWREVEGDWTTPLRVGANYIWSDATGKLRIRDAGAAPANDTDGVVVGTQVA